MNEEKLGHSVTGHCIVRPHKGPLKFRKEAHAFLNPPHALGQANYHRWHLYSDILTKFHPVCSFSLSQELFSNRTHDSLEDCCAMSFVRVLTKL